MLLIEYSCRSSCSQLHWCSSFHLCLTLVSMASWRLSMIHWRPVCLLQWSLDFFVKSKLFSYSWPSWLLSSESLLKRSLRSKYEELCANPKGSMDRVHITNQVFNPGFYGSYNQVSNKVNGSSLNWAPWSENYCVKLLALHIGNDSATIGNTDRFLKDKDKIYL